MELLGIFCVEQDLLCQVDRAVLGLLKNFPDVLSNHPQAEQLQAPQQENQDNDGGVSGTAMPQISFCKMTIKR